MRDPYGIDERVRVTIRMRKSFVDAIEKNDDRSFSAGLHKALDQGVEGLARERSGDDRPEWAADTIVDVRSGCHPGTPVG